MSTKCILHGGVMKVRSDTNKAFYEEMLKGVVDPSVLLVYFARGLDEYDYLFDRDTKNFAWAVPSVESRFEIANEKDLIDQVKRNNVILFGGGETKDLIDTVQRSGLDKSMLNGKTVAGSSAGAYLISEWYYTNSGREVRPGLGFLPIATWAHYRADRGSEYWLSEEQIADIEKQLQEKVGDGEVVKLPEQEFVIYNQN